MLDQAGRTHQGLPFNASGIQPNELTLIAAPADRQCVNTLVNQVGAQPLNQGE